ncbi:MAG: hypothetical protein ACK417_06510 [Bacteroidia bacterium]
MNWLLLSIGFSVVNFLLFRQFERWKINTLVAVATNYISCILLGWWLQGDLPRIHLTTPWLPWAAFIGLLFVSMFVLIGLSAQKLGVNITTVAAKMSFVIPMSLAYGLYQSKFEPLHALALLLALAAIALSSSRNYSQKAEPWRWVLPMSIFLGGGMADATLNYVEVKLLAPADQGVFLMVLFGTSGVFGWLGLGIRALQGKREIELKSMLAGLGLGISNFLTVFALLQAFSSELPGAFIFPLLNVGTIVLAALGAWWLFKEQPKGKQWAGLAAALLAILVYSWQT